MPNTNRRIVITGSSLVAVSLRNMVPSLNCICSWDRGNYLAIGVSLHELRLSGRLDKTEISPRRKNSPSIRRMRVIRGRANFMAFANQFEVAKQFDEVLHPRHPEITVTIARHAAPAASPHKLSLVMRKVI